MKVVIRCDAAPAIGTGHVVRCLTLAERLRAGGAQVRFICRAHPGHMAGAITARGFAVDLLPAPEILQKTRILRQFMYNMDEIESMEMVLKSMRATKSNVEFFDMMRRGG
eukprot:gene27858-34639_t